MHSIKKAARREAWYNPDGGEESRAYNPFARRNNNPRRLRDEENGASRGLPLEHVVTENDAGPSPIESRRMEEHQYSGVKKSGTFPSDSINKDTDFAPNREKSEDVPSSADTINHGSDRTLTNGVNKEAPDSMVDSSAAPNGVARKRKRNKFMPWKKSDNDDEGFSRADTGDSKKKKKHKKIPVMQQFKAVFFSWINILLVAVPVGIAVEYAGVNKTVVFVINFIAIIPLAAMLSYSTEELAMYIGETLGGLLNATFGNAVELIVSIIALLQGKILIVQTSLLGSMLSNLLLVLGMCFFAGGLKRTEQFFNLTVAQTASSLLALAIGALIIPTAFVTFAVPSNASDTNEIPSRITPVSRGVAIMLLFVYGCYLFFQLSTHNDMYNEPSQKTPKRQSKKKGAGDALRGIATIGAGTGAAYAGGEVNRENLIHEEEEEEEGPNLSVIGAIVTLAVSTVFIALCAEYMVSSINELAESVSPEFIGLILLPIVGNAAEHATAVTVAIKDKMDLSIGVAIGSSLQIALLVLPLMVLFSWFGIGAPAVLTMSFDGFQVACLFIAIIVVNYVVQDGKSHWLEGIMLMVAYLIIALSAWFYPAAGDVAG